MRCGDIKYLSFFFFFFFFFLRGVDTLGRFSATREITFMTSCFLYCMPSPFWKGVYSLRKEFAPSGSKFFPYRVDPFTEGDKTILTELSPLKVYQCPISIFKAKLADDKIYFFLIFFFQKTGIIIHENCFCVMSNAWFLGKNKNKIFQNVTWNVYSACKAL